MNYQWHYDQLMITRKSRIPEKGQYYERHHIIPKSLGGDNSSENLVTLTAREHFLAHWLLWRIHRNRDMAFSFFAMCAWTKNGRINASSIAYEEARENSAELRSEYMKSNKEQRSSIMKDIWNNRTPDERASHISLMIKSKSYKKSINETKRLEKLKLRVRTYPSIECPKCGQFGRSGVMKRWHFDNCKIEKT